ncbi:MAG: tetratricopeptide repeat protein [Cryobacterium sp.]|nr:tetratricopeptide repeat protein [Oligoflexia bacterium]
MVSNQNAENSLKRLLLALALTLATVPAAVAETYPASEMASVRSSDENKIRQLRGQEIAELRQTLGRRLPTNRKADLYVRLAETYLEAYRAEFLNEGRVHEKRLADGNSEKFIDRANSRPYLRLGIRACEEVVRLGIKHPKLDQIYYFLGVYNDELEDEASSIRWFRALTQKFPESPYVGEAYRAIAESAFGKSNYSEALQYYELALPRYQGNALPRLLQKKAWCHYRMKQYDRAVSVMKTAISEAGKNDRFLSLKDEALRDMATFMTETGKVDEALAYFKQVGGDKDYYPRALERLGAQYERNADTKKAILVYESLLKTNPNSTDEAAFRVREKLFELDLKRSQYGSALKRIQGMVVPKGGESETEVAAKNLRILVRKTAIDCHENFRKTQDKGSLAVAENFYTVYLNQFLAKEDEKKETPEVQMYLAEVKRDMDKPSDAAFLYKQVIRSKDDRYAKQAAAFWMASLGETIERAKKSGKTEEIETYEKDFIEASDYVAENFESRPEGLQARLNVIIAIAGNPSKLAEAEKRIADLVGRAPGSKQALTASRLRAQVYSDRLPKKSEEVQGSPAAVKLLDTITDIRGNSALMAADQKLQKGALAAFLESEETRIKIGVIASQEKSKDFGAAAKGYEEFAMKEPKRELAERAFDSAVSNDVKVGDFDSAVRVVSKWSARFPDSKKAADSLRDVATSAIIAGQFEKAASLFRVLGQRGDANAMEVAGRLYEGAGNLTEAATDFRLYLEKFPKSGNRGPIALSLSDWYAYSKNDSQAVKYLKLCFDENNSTSAECGARLADLYDRLENHAQANHYFTAVAARGTPKRKGAKVGPENSPWVGYARFHLAFALEKDTQFRRLTLPDDKLKQGLAERLKFLEKLNQAYGNVVEANGPWAVAALDRLANWVMEFADSVDQIEAPKTASPESIASFRKGLKSVSDPLRAKALGTWQTAYQKAVERELLSPVLPAIADRLADFGAQTPARAQGFRDKYRLTGQPADGGKEGRLAAFERIRQTLTTNAKDFLAWIDYGNLLWGEGKPLLAKIAYERALLLNPRAAAALNNRGVLIASGTGQEDWIRVAEANAYFNQAIEKDELFLAAKFNRGAILNYYRIFSKARPYWNQVAAVAPQPDVIDGIAISEQGLGQFESAVASFNRATKAGGASSRPAVEYHTAARVAATNPSQCLKLTAKALDETSGFERQAVEHLNALCARSGK